jgi:transcription antitermination factor NusB
MEKISRNQENFIIMTVIYDELADFTAGSNQPFRDVNEIILEITDIPLKDHSDYVQNTIANVLNHYGEIVSVFLPKLNNWKWERLPLLTRAVLLMSYAHFYYVEKIDKRIIINVAVELAKKYIEEKQAKFINAILDEVL